MEERTMGETNLYGRAKLPVCTRRVLSGDGEMASENAIYCPLRDQSLTVEECELCDDYDGLAIDTTKERTFVACRRLTIDAARTLLRARPAALTKRSTS